jgi:LacI family transcriptional regulator
MPFADRFHPPLTTVRTPHREMGVAAADLLLELLAHPETAPRQSILPVALEVRGSTAPARA